MLVTVKLFNNNNYLRIKFWNSGNNFSKRSFKGVPQIRRDFSQGTRFLNHTRSAKQSGFYPHRSNYLSVKRYSSSNSYFSLDDYDIIGFDLDNTICEYNLSNLVKLEYNAIAEYLVEKHEYNRNALLKPLQSQDVDLLQKGLIIDTERGNLLKTRRDGYIFKACYGSKFLTDEEIVKCYGADRKWCVTTEFGQNPVIGWTGPLGNKLRTLADYFDMPAAIALSRCVDSKLAEASSFNNYNIWKDLLSALSYVYSREHFSLNLGFFKDEIKVNAGAYYRKCSPVVMDWLKRLKDSKVTFLVTGSNMDYAAHTAANCLGEDWRDYFHSVVFYARKPGFFVGGRPFMKVDGSIEVGTVRNEDIRLGQVYSQGNWQGLLELLTKATGKTNAKCLYIGDNLIQDIFTVAHYTRCDTVAVAEELNAEFFRHPHKEVLTSRTWGSYFAANSGAPTLWDDIIRNYSKICVPTLDVLASKEIGHKFSAFSQTSLGYHLKMGSLNLINPSHI